MTTRKNVDELTVINVEPAVPETPSTSHLIDQGRFDDITEFLDDVEGELRAMVQMIADEVDDLLRDWQLHSMPTSIEQIVPRLRRLRRDYFDRMDSIQEIADDLRKLKDECRERKLALTRIIWAARPSVHGDTDWKELLRL
jgi:hypothetical protein